VHYVGNMKQVYTMMHGQENIILVLRFATELQ